MVNLGEVLPCLATLTGFRINRLPDNVHPPAIWSHSKPSKFFHAAPDHKTVAHGNDDVRVEGGGRLPFGVPRDGHSGHSI